MLKLWEYMSKSDEWAIYTPDGESSILWERPFTCKTGEYIICCSGFERRIIREIDLASYAIEEHIKICCIDGTSLSSKDKSGIAALAAKGEELEQVRAELAALREENAALKAELEEARAALEKARQGQTGQAKGTTVNAKKWKDSVQAVCGLLVFILQGTKDNWRSDDFTEELRKRCRDYHTDVARIAWRTLPDDLKHGPGRPAEKPGNPEHTETIDDLPF